MSTAEERGLGYRQDVLVKNTEGKEISPWRKVRNSKGKREKGEIEHPHGLIVRRIPERK